MRGMASTSACSWVTSWRLAPVRITASGMPCASVMRWCFEPGRARSVGLGPVFDPHQPRGSRRSRRPRATSLCGPLRVALQEAVRAVGPRHRRPASRADGASSSCRCRNPSRAARAHDLCRDVAPEVAERQDRRASLFLSAAASGGPGQAALCCAMLSLILSSYPAVVSSLSRRERRCTKCGISSRRASLWRTRV